MIETQLIMVEGLPSTGKTTNARFLHIQLERNNIGAMWIHEVAMPHPVLFFDEAGFTHGEYERFMAAYPKAAGILSNMAVFRESTVGIHLPEIEWNCKDEIDEEVYQALLEHDVWKFPLDAYKKFALEKWAHFTEKALRNRDEVYIIDSAVFQFQIFTFLLKNRPYEELQNFIDQILDIIHPLNPCLIYLYRDNAEATIDYLEKDRGTSYLDYLWNRDKDQPYYIGKPPGAESFKQFLRDYAGMAERLFGSFPANKLCLEISGGNWACLEDEMLSFLDVSRMPGPAAFPQNGVYANEALGFAMRVDGLSFIDPCGDKRKLFPKSQNEFYVDWLPTVLRFEDEKIIISGSQICERWTKTGTIYSAIPSTVDFFNANQQCGY
ncbi:MAG: hypothetical protein FWG34_12335 [Oscillospiraceae bacterium]|nr:hypothetical protein [Oscillospiraceae bacterium]